MVCAVFDIYSLEIKLTVCVCVVVYMINGSENAVTREAVTADLAAGELCGDSGKNYIV